MVTRLKAVAFATTIAIAIATPIAPRASAQARRPVAELVGERGSLDAAKLDELVSLELGADASRVDRVTFDVRGGRVRVEVLLGDERREASVTLSATEPERALALFVAELARGATRPVPSPAGPASAPTSTLPHEDRPPPASSPSRRWRMSMLGTIGARVMTADGALLATPKLEVGAQKDGLRIGVTARDGYAMAEDRLGTVRAHVLTGGIAATYMFLASRSIALATGPRLDMGLIAARGDGSNGESTTAFTLGGSWDLELHWKLLDWITFLGAIEAGTLVRGVELHADDRDVLHLFGPFLGLTLGAML